MLPDLTIEGVVLTFAIVALQIGSSVAVYYIIKFIIKEWKAIK